MAHGEKARMMTLCSPLRWLYGWEPARAMQGFRLQTLTTISSDGVKIPLPSVTGNRITDKDRAARKEVAHLSVSVINGGILLTLNRAKNRVNSFRYCLGDITPEFSREQSTREAFNLANDIHANCASAGISCWARVTHQPFSLRLNTRDSLTPLPLKQKHCSSYCR